MPKQESDQGQAYFWTEEWQEAEREAGQDLRQGRTAQFETLEALVADLDGGDRQSRSSRLQREDLDCQE